MQSAIGIYRGRYRITLGNASRHVPRALLSTSRSTKRRAERQDVDLPTLDAKWQQQWEAWKAEGIDRNYNNAYGEKKYILPMFPYPSGDLHLGHLRVYTIADVLARFRAMQGYKVMHTIGWDAFGLPAENAAIERGIDPAVWTKQNIARMKGQLRSMNGDWDWDREFATCDPSFYKHTQRIFLLLHARGLAYQAESLVNYDPVDKTVLANEQVDANGCSWRSGAKVEKRQLKQWFLRISEFRESLLSDLKHLRDRWPHRVLSMQKNWLGKSQGAQVRFPVAVHGQEAHTTIEVFTTRPDTLFGVQYLALASNHPIVVELAKTNSELQAFLDTIPALPPDSKIGYLLPDICALNPLAGYETTPDATKAPLPIYVAPYVLGDYGDGAVMGVPGHDVRDHAFWKHNREEDPIRIVVAPTLGGTTLLKRDEPFTLAHGSLTSHSGPHEGQSVAEATRLIIARLESQGLGRASETWRLRDWLISRQRYWGTPIPIIHCDTCGPVPVPEEDLPVELPTVQGHWLKGKTGNPLSSAHDWVNTPCPKCGSAAKRDTDTMDTFVDSSWYFMRFPDSHNNLDPFSPETANSALPVDLYVGGVEHAILHLLYARFISKFLATTPFWPAGLSPDVKGEPFRQLLTQGMVHGKTYSDPSNGRFLKPDEVDLSKTSIPLVIATGEKANVSYEKMSKSKYNGVDPGKTMSRYGADATRAHILFQAPVTEVLEWDEEKISGITRWLRRLYSHVHDYSSLPNQDHGDVFNTKAYFTAASDSLSNPNKSRELKQKLETERNLWRAVQQTILSVTDSYSKTHSLNTCVSTLMTLTNTLLHPPSPTPVNASLEHLALTTLLKMLAPITPAFAEECWTLLHPPSSKTRIESIFQHRFPELDGTLEMLASRSQSCAVQINGKFRFAVNIPFPPANLDSREMQRWITGVILETAEGKTKLTGKVDVDKAKKVFVVGEGRTVNYII